MLPLPFPIGASVSVPVTERLSSGPIVVVNDKGVADADSNSDNDVEPKTEPERLMMN